MYLGYAELNSEFSRADRIVWWEIAPFVYHTTKCVSTEPLQFLRYSTSEEFVRSPETRQNKRADCMNPQILLDSYSYR